MNVVPVTTPPQSLQRELDVRVGFELMEGLPLAEHMRQNELDYPTRLTLAIESCPRHLTAAGSVSPYLPVSSICTRTRCVASCIPCR